MSSPLRWKVRFSLKVITGSAPARRRRHPLAAHQLLHRHPDADIVVGDDHRAGAAEILVPAGMIAMPVGVDHEADRIGIERAHRRDDPLGRRRILVVDQDVAVGAVGEADIAAAAEQDRDAGRDPLDADLGRRRRLVGDGGRGERAEATARIKRRMAIPFRGADKALS